MNENRINGYIVIAGEGHRRYGGVDRHPWQVVGDAFYSNQLPESLRPVYAAADALAARGFWMPTVATREDAKRLLAFSRKHNPESRLIGVYSEYIKTALGREAWVDARATLLGVDVVAIGEWSLLGALDDAGIRLPGTVLSRLNDVGLLSDAAAVGEVEALYRELAATNIVEPIGDGAGPGVEGVQVFDIAV